MIALKITKRLNKTFKSDKEHVQRVQNWFEKMGGRENLKKVFYKIDEDFIENTVPYEKTIISTK